MMGGRRGGKREGKREGKRVVGTFFNWLRNVREKMRVSFPDN